jgi:hypothetical protein
VADRLGEEIEGCPPLSRLKNSWGISRVAETNRIEFQKAGSGTALLRLRRSQITDIDCQNFFQICRSDPRFLAPKVIFDKEMCEI